ncbi:Putative transposase element L1Md-A101/L1Md-A102/L1Md-A2 [Cricetulus griseus]|uniref:Putative transposase element L1Md-A101/L1Md-A102/L1Md-A2 n=1 Tax=Cricetulus griseus TaxID=10029 RepID=G3H557_CRIGR|nr:Putative transposase element L1Md-A101/L1Md-A102/L1Md-A2 [Cricetulus griseus]
MLEIEKLGKRSGTTDVSITNRIQEMEERISGVEDSLEYSHGSKKISNPTNL